jgi:hypothetical protein
MVLDQSNIDGLIPAIPVAQKKAFLDKRKEAIEATCNFLDQVNDAVMAEL